MEKIGPSTMLRRVTRTAIVMLATFGVFATMSGAAQAAGWHGISGETYSHQGTYWGATVFTKSGSGSVKGRFSEVAGDEMFVILRNNSTGITQDSVKNYADESSRTLGSFNGGVRFKVGYARNTTCQWPWCDHDFVGELYY
ncbi:hypothetical protein STSO111631_13760 [Stackebrandtia soli]